VILPLPTSRRLLNLPPFFHPNLLEKIRVGANVYLIGRDFSGAGDINLQRKALSACISKALGIRVKKFFELSNKGFFLGYPSAEANYNIDEPIGAPVFSRVGWFPFQSRELLFILRMMEERGRRKIFSIVGPKGSGKSWVIRRVVDFSPEGILLDGRWKNLEKLAERILRERRWRVIGMENFGEGTSKEIFRVLSLSLEEAVFLLEGEYDGGYSVEVRPPEFSQWKKNLVFLDEEAREIALSILRENPCPGVFIKALVQGKQNDRKEEIKKAFPETGSQVVDGETLLDFGEYERVIEVTADSNDGRTRVLRAQAFLSMGRRKQAEAVLKRCRTKLCRALAAYLQGKEFLPKPDDPPEVFLWAGKGAEKRRDLLMAEALYRRGYTLALSRFDARTAGLIASDLGALFFRQEDLEQAEKFFRNSLWLLSSSRSTKAYTISCYNLAEVLFRKGEWNEAERLYRISYRESLKSPFSLSHGYDCSSLGYLLFLKGNPEEGKKLLYTALKIFLEKGSPEELSDIAMKIFEYSIDRGEEPEGLLNLKLLHPAEVFRRFFAGEKMEGEDPWTVFLKGLKSRNRKMILKAATGFSSKGKEGEEFFCYYMLGKFNLWNRRDAGKLRRALKWYRRRGCFRERALENILSIRNSKSETEIRSIGEDDVFEELFALSVDKFEGRFRGFFLLDDEGNILLRKATPSIPWFLVRNYREPHICDDSSRCHIQELKEELFLKGIRSYMVAGKEIGRGILIGFVGDLVENSYSHVELEEMQRLLSLATDKIELRSRFHLFVGGSWAMRKVYFKLRKASSHGYPVLIVGETGTGKELAARSIHELWGRGNFVPVNCAAIPESLLESELFGYKAGAFTGASRDKRGLLEEADGGVLFLDEIGEIPPSLQAKLLRVLQEKKIRRLGDTVERPVDFKLVSASNRDLPEMVEEGKFRRDLYYRISTFVVEMPPLRERKEDILPLAEYFAERISGTKIEISRAAKDILLNHSWPGNVRELEGVIRAALAMMEEGETLLLPQHLPSFLKPDIKRSSLEDARNQWERGYILAALEANSWEISKTASELGISRQHLYNLIRKHRIK